MMKKLYFFYCLSIIVFCSCSNNDVSEQTESNLTSLIDFGEYIPAVINVENSLASITLAPSAREYYLNLNRENGEVYLNIIKNAEENKLFVKIFLIENTNEIAEVQSISENDIKDKFQTQPMRASSDDLAYLLPSVYSVNSYFEKVKESSIPCNYIGDGCYARAHKVKQVLEENKVGCYKIFIYGDLSASNGTCCTEWRYHVAVLVTYFDHTDFFNFLKEKVFDPSLFDHPVSIEEWKNACLNTSCNPDAKISKVLNTSSDVYYVSQNEDIHLYDNNYINTDCILSAYSRVSGCGWPPNTSHCGF
jgi:hypothetical protein